MIYCVYFIQANKLKNYFDHYYYFKITISQSKIFLLKAILVSLNKVDQE